MTQNHYSQNMKTKIVDSHCHLDFKDFSDDLDEVIKKAKLSSVEYFLSISVNFKDFKNILGIANKYPNVWCTTGVHPSSVPKKFLKNEISKVIKNISVNLKHKKVIGVGETGLDFFRGEENKTNQIDYFNAHLMTSGKNNVPTIVHTRAADKETVQCIKNSVLHYNTKGLIHCFSSSKKFAKEILNHGFYISFSGLITFKKATELVEVVKYVPLDRILVETDSPYLAPDPLRGKRNEPCFVTHTLEKIAEIKKIKSEELAHHTTNNFFKLFSNIK